jgi:O-methyltransferase involved in polyketide biosynthesis
MSRRPGSERDGEARRDGGDLSITALYTAATWQWGGLAGSDVLATPEAATVFRVTNAALRLANPLQRPKLPYALLHRHVLIDRLVERAGEHAGVQQVIELAAGLSARGVRMTARDTLSYSELDLAPVIQKKRELLNRSASGAAILARSRFSLIAGDALSTPLEPLVRTDHGVVMVIAEGLLMYLDAPTQRRLARRIAQLLHGTGGAWVFDYVPPSEQPPPGVAGRVLGALMRRFTGGRGFARDLRSRWEIVHDLQAAGFTTVEVLEPQRIARIWKLPFPEVPTQQLVFVCTTDEQAPSWLRAT